MAEVVGVVASAISIVQLAGQITESVIALKQYWDQIKDAPSEISYLLEEIDSFQLIFHAIGDDQMSNSPFHPNNPSMRQISILCDQAAEQLKSLVDDLSRKVEGKSGWKKTLGSIKVVLKKEDIQRLKERLKCAISLMHMAQIRHNYLMMQMLPDIMLARLHEAHARTANADANVQEWKAPQYQSTLKPCPPSNSNAIAWRESSGTSISRSRSNYLFGLLEYRNQLCSRKGKETRKLEAKYTLPEWISARALEYSFDVCKWKGTFKTHRVLSVNSIFCHCLESGDVAGVRKILSNGEGFSNDRFQNARMAYLQETALHVAARMGNLEMCKLLIMAGADLLAPDSLNRTPLNFIVTYARRIELDYEKKAEDVTNIIRYFLESGADEDLVDNVRILKNFEGSTSTFKYLQDQFFPPYKTLPINDISRIICEMTSQVHYADVASDLLDLQLGDIELCQMIKYAEQTGTSLLNLVFEYLFNVYHLNIFSSPGGTYAILKNETYPGRCLVRRLIQSGASLHYPPPIDKIKDCLDWDNKHGGVTPLWAFVEECLSHPDMKFSQALLLMEKLLREVWLADLVLLDVDLERYGRDEYACYKDSKAREMHGLKIDYLLNRQVRNIELGLDEYCGGDDDCFIIEPIGFQYGPRPEDWHFWFPERTDQFAGDFWNLIENGLIERQKDLRRLPGSWVEEIEEEDN